MINLLIATKGTKAEIIVYKIKWINCFTLNVTFSNFFILLMLILAVSWN